MILSNCLYKLFYVYGLEWPCDIRLQPFVHTANASFCRNSKATPSTPDMEKYTYPSSHSKYDMWTLWFIYVSFQNVQVYLNSIPFSILISFSRSIPWPKLFDANLQSSAKITSQQPRAYLNDFSHKLQGSSSSVGMLEYNARMQDVHNSYYQ